VTRMTCCAGTAPHAESFIVRDLPLEVIEQMQQWHPDTQMARSHFYSKDSTLKVYVRLSIRFSRRSWETHETLELATVSLDKYLQGVGCFSRLLDLMCEEANRRNRILLVENIVNDKVLRAVRNRGFVQYDDCRISPTYWKV
jgi:hypothetical protein